jgi:arylsulfatase B
MIRSSLLILLVTAFISPLASAYAPDQKASKGADSPPVMMPNGDQPNIVIILVDDMGWNDVGYHGSEIQTPRIDSLAAEGVVLDRFYAQPTCSPTRAALMTGKSAMSQGVLSPLSKINPTGLPLKRRLLPEYLQDAGYQTAMVGKWHLGYRKTPYLPTSRGFEHFYGHLTGGIGYWDHVHGGGLDWQRNGKTLREEGYSTHLMADEAVTLIENRDEDKPLFLYASFNAPHLPNEAPTESVERYAHLDNPNRQLHAAMVSELDTAVGRIMDTLDKEGMLNNTLVWFMSDNGGLNPSSYSKNLVTFATQLDNWYGEDEASLRILEFIRVNVLEGAADNAPFRRGKQSVYEGGVRVPALVYWKNKLQPLNTNAMVTVEDVLPTLLTLAGAESGEDSFDGTSRWPLIESGSPTPSPDYVTQAQGDEALYRYPWKLIQLSTGDKELYNIEVDPTEKNDVAAENPQLVEELAKALAERERGKSVHIPIYKSVMNMDFFGGEEIYPPWAEQVQ